MDKYRLLVVDDLEKWHEKARDILSDRFEIEKAYNLEEAKKKIQEKDPPYHVVLSDIRLVEGDPFNTDGVKVAEYVKDQWGDATRAIMWTAYASVETAIKAMKLNAMDYFEKSPIIRDGKRLYFDDRREEFKDRVIEAAELADSAQWNKQRLQKDKKWEKELLLVSKDGSWKDTIFRILATHGYEAVFRSTYDDAKEEIRDKNFRALLVDMDNGETVDEGFQFIQWVISASPETELILFSEKNDGKMVSAAYSTYEVRDFFFKGNEFNYEKLIDCIKPIYLLDNQIFFIAELEKKNDEVSDELTKSGISHLSYTDYEFIIRADRKIDPGDQYFTSIPLTSLTRKVTVEVSIYLEQGDDVYDFEINTNFWEFFPEHLPAQLRFKLIKISNNPSEQDTIQIRVELVGDQGWFRKITTGKYLLDGEVEK